MTMLDLTDERLRELAAQADLHAADSEYAAIARAALEARAVIRRAENYDHFSGRPSGATASMFNELRAIIGGTNV